VEYNALFFNDKPCRLYGFVPPIGNQRKTQYQRGFKLLSVLFATSNANQIKT
jgi:hypothetical protein